MRARFRTLIAFARGDKNGNCGAAEAVDAAHRLEEHKGFQIFFQEISAARAVSVRTATIRALILNERQLNSQPGWKASRKWLCIF